MILHAFALDDVLVPLARQSIQAAILAIIVGAAMLAFGSRLSARWRFVLWSLVFARLALPVSLPAPFSISWAAASVPQQTHVEPVRPKLTDGPAFVGAAPQREVGTPVDVPNSADLTPSLNETLQPRIVPATPNVAQSAKPASVVSIWEIGVRVLVIGWLAGVGVLAIRRLRQHRRLAALLRRCSSVSDPRLIALLDECRYRLGIRSRVALLESVDNVGPALTGVFSNAIVLPTAARGFTDEQLQLVFLHELAHVARRDTLVQELFSMVSAVYWFHPLVWWVQRRLECERELDCDAIVLQAIGLERRAAYGELLLSLLGLSVRPASHPALLGTVGNLSILKRRIAMIGVFPRLPGRSTALGLLLLLVLAFVGVFREPNGEAAAAPVDPPAAQQAVEAIQQQGEEKKLADLPKAGRVRGENPAGRFIAKLDELRDKRGSDEWADVLRKLIELDKAAIPEVIAELDATEDEAMLRCMAFVARGIGDKRAAPALIRALARSCVKAGSDYGLIAEDPNLLAFLRLHQSGPSGARHYTFGRPVNEITRTLQKWSGKKFGDDEITGVFLGGSDRQKYMQRKLYHDCARRWAGWWEQNWKMFTDDASYSKVNLPPLRGLSEPTFASGAIINGSSGHVVQSVLSPRSKYVFLDLDTGRTAALPEKFRGDGLAKRMDEIEAWASEQGYDLMGTEVTDAAGKTHFVLRGIGLMAWDIGRDRWATLEAELATGEPLKLGRPAGALLCAYDSKKGTFAYEERTCFAFRTRDGTRGVINLGVEVHDDSLRPGGFSSSDEEGRPTAFYKGRRLGYRLIGDAK